MFRLYDHRAVCVWMVLACVSPAVSQDRAGRRQFVQGLLQTFIESQLTDEARENRPAAPARQPSASSLGSSQLQRASRVLNDASREMSQLIGALQTDMYRANGVRQLLSLAMNVNADAAVLSRRLARTTDVETLREPLRQLDQDWRTLEYRLSQTPNLSSHTLGLIQRIKQYEEELAAIFQVSTQVDTGSISQNAVQMNHSLRSLLEDIRYEISDSELANRLLQDGRDTYDRLQQFIRTTQVDPRYEKLKNQFRSLEAEWSRYQRRFRDISNRFVQRQVQRIDDSMRNIANLLYLSVGQVDREDLVHTTELLQRDTEELLGHVNLKMLSELPAARGRAIEAAADLDTSCQDLLDVLHAGDDYEVTRELFVLVYDQWQRLKMGLEGISSQQARQSMRDIEGSLSALQAILGVQLEFDRNQAMELASNLEGEARHLQADIRDFFGRPNRYPREFQTNSLRAAAEFQASANQLYEGLRNGDNFRVLKTHCDHLVAAWESVNQTIPRFNSAEQAHLNNIRRHVTPQVVRMQTLLSL